jgi:hypothetical protein
MRGIFVIFDTNVDYLILSPEGQEPMVDIKGQSPEDKQKHHQIFIQEE